MAARVRVERENGVGRLTLARPEKKNALDQQTAVELFESLESLESDGGIRVVILSGDGDDFCAGADLDALEQMLDATPDAHRDDAERLGRVFVRLRSMTKPVIAAVKGRALAGGAGLATACDIVLAHERATFGYPEVRVGFVPAMVMTMLRRSVGEKHAFDLIATARIIDAIEAERIGLVSRVVSATQFGGEVAAVAAGLAKAPQSALMLTKRLFYQLDTLAFDASIAAGVHTNVEARATADFRDGVRRFTRRKDSGS